LKYDTLTAVERAGKASSNNTGEFGVRAINATYYVIGGELHVRSSCSFEENILGKLYEGEAVNVIGAVTKGGKDIGWYQINFNGGTGYVVSDYLSPNPGNAKSDTDKENAAEKKTSDNDDVKTMTLYAKDGSEVTVFYDEKSGTWMDFRNSFVYTPMAGAMYYCAATGDYWDADPNYWKENPDADPDYNEFVKKVNGEDEDVETMTLYSKDGGQVLVFYEPETGLYKDYHNNYVYSPMAGAMFYCEATNSYWDADPDYWEENPEANPDYEVYETSLHSGYNDDDEDVETMTLYSEGGGQVLVYFDKAAGTYRDYHNGYTYEPMAGGLCYCSSTGTYWNTDPGFWDSHDPDEFDYDDFEENAMTHAYGEDEDYDGTYYGEDEDVD
jgi:hypothetical protein